MRLTVNQNTKTFLIERLVHSITKSITASNMAPTRLFIRGSSTTTQLLPTGAPNYAGAVNPSDVNMRGVQAAIALICVGFVLGGIWFFFWAKNGGFKFQKGDWEEYKSTVLRRKGPNGTTLSNATKSTRLGGGSVVGQGYSDRDAASYVDDTSTVYTGTMTELSSSTAPIIKNKNKEKYDDASTQYTGDNRQARREARRERHERAKERKQREMREAEFENGHDGDVRAYMKEKPARVGGINAASDTLHYGTDYTTSEPSVTYSAPRGPAPAPTQPSTYAPSTPSHAPRPSRNINISNNTPERRDARDMRESHNTRRDFSYTIGAHQEREQFTSAPTRGSTPPPTRVGPTVQLSNTKTYHHPLPGLSPASGRQGGGFRRGAGSELED